MRAIQTIFTTALAGLATAMQMGCEPEVAAPAPTAKEQSVKQQQRADLSREVLRTKHSEASAAKDKEAAKMAAADPELLLALITQMRAETLQRPQNLRRVLHYLETFVDMGPAAIPTIRAFLQQNQDIEYGFTTTPYYPRPAVVKASDSKDSKDAKKEVKEATKRTGWNWDASYNNNYYAMSTEYLLPPSLRLGLLEVVARIGGPESDEVLTEVLRETGRGIEVAMVDRLLEETAGDRHRDAVLAAARDLLLDPPKVEQPSQMDTLSRRYLIGMLIKYQDESFAEKAQTLLIQANGSLDNDVLMYLTQTLKERSLPMLVAAHKDPRLNPQWAGSLLPYLMRYVGDDALADQFFRDIVADTKNPQLRSTAVSYLGYGSRDKEMAQRRLELLNSVKDQLSADRQMEAMIKYAEQSLQRSINPQSTIVPGQQGSMIHWGAEGANGAWSYAVPSNLQILGNGGGRFRFETLQAAPAPGGDTGVALDSLIIRLGDKVREKK